MRLAVLTLFVASLAAAWRLLMGKRWNKRHTKETADKKYAELSIAKPTQYGRGVSEKQLALAAKDLLVTRKVRGKILKAVNTILTKKSQPATDMKTLFEGVKARVGKKPEVAAKK